MPARVYSVVAGNFIEMINTQKRLSYKICWSSLATYWYISRYLRVAAGSSGLTLLLVELLYLSKFINAFQVCLCNKDEVDTFHHLFPTENEYK